MTADPQPSASGDAGWSREPFISLPSDKEQDSFSRSSGNKPESKDNGDIFADRSRAAWHSAQLAVPRCDFSPSRHTLTSLTGGFRAVTLWRRSIYGMSLTDIKQNPEMPEFCAGGLIQLISSVIGQSPSPDEFVIVAPPKRRHPGKENFASRMCSFIAAGMGLSYIDDFAVCRTRQRIAATFSLAAPLPDQSNIIVVDDIITTGSTLIAMHSLISSLGKNDIYFAAILNRK